MPGQLSNDIKEVRSRIAGTIAEKMSLSFRESLIDSAQNVLFEERVGDFFVGHTPNYVKVYLRSGADLHNQVLSVKLTALFEDGAECILL